MYVFVNGRLITFDPSGPYFEDGAVAVEGAKIVCAGPVKAVLKKYPNAETIDAGGGIIMPGLINAHTHFYGSFLRGYEPKGYDPHSLYEMLAGKNWRLDRSLSYFDCANAAYAAAIDSLKCGVTTLFDHHACNPEPMGTFSAIAGAAAAVGVRVCLSYGVSSRCGMKACSEGINENESAIAYCEALHDERFAAAFGLHAPFTLSDIDIAQCVSRNNGRTGFHIHVSEGQDDNYVCMHNYRKTPVRRLFDLGVLGEKTILAHCVNVSEAEAELIAETGSFVVTNPQSNAYSAVGTAPVPMLLQKGVKVCLGTDAFSGDMFESARALLCVQRQTAEGRLMDADTAANILFKNNAELASRYFGAGIGVIREGAPADIIVMDHTPFTHFDERNISSQLIFGLSGRECRTAMVAGRLVMHDGVILGLDEK